MKRPSKIILIGFLLAIFIGPDISAQDEIQKTPTDDTCMFEASPDYSPGDIDFIAVEKQTNNGLTYSFIRFDISSIPSGAEILDAQLQLKCEHKNKSSIEMDIGFAGGSWAEETLTWNNKPTINVWSGHRYAVGSEGSSKYYDVTDYVERWHEGGYSNYGFVLIAVTDESSFTFYSKEKGSTYAPRLFVSYTSPPEKAINPYPSNGATNLGWAVNPSWENGGGATSYKVYFGTNQSPDDGEYKGEQTSTLYEPGTLAGNTTYYWRIDAVNSSGTTTGDVWHFTTFGLPEKPINPNPVNGATNIDVNADLYWANGGGATSYRVYFGTDPTPDDTEDKGERTTTSYNLVDLSPNTTFYWRIDAINSNGTTTGDIWHFTTSASFPSKPINPNPANGLTSVNVDANISWSDGGGATSYKVYFGTNSSPTYKKEQTGTSYEPGTLAGNTTYYWRIDAVNSSGTTTGDIWHFTTAGSLPSDLIWEDNFNSVNDWDGKVYKGDGNFTEGAYDGENVGIFYMSGSPGVFYTFKQVSQNIPAGSILKAKWFYESSGSYNNSENSDGGKIIFTNSIPSTENDIGSETIQELFECVNYPMYQWNTQQFEITENIPVGSYIAIGGAVWPSYIYNNWDFIKIYSSTTDIPNELSLLSNYKLYNNYPNPFNPTTQIKFELPKAEQVELKVYDNLGREVVTLVNEQKPAGSYEIEFNASNLSNGVYFYELRAGDFRDVKKLVLLK